jgi:hypothetical protein
VKRPGDGYTVTGVPACGAPKITTVSATGSGLTFVTS